MKIIKSKYDDKSYNILRFDKLIGGIYSIMTEIFYKRHTHKSDTIGISFTGSYNYTNILADIYSILKLGKTLYIFNLVKSKRFQKVIDMLNNDKIHYIVTSKINEYIANNPSILYFSTIYNIEKFEIFRHELPKYLPGSLLNDSVVIWTINNQDDYLSIILKNINHNLIVNEINMNDTDDLHIVTRYTLKDSVNIPFKNDIIIPKYSMNEYTEKKYFYVLKKHGQTGDYIINYIGDIDKQVIAIRRALKRR